MLILVVLFAGISRGSLEFQDDRPIILTWDQVRSGEDIVVCNYGNSSLPSLSATLEGFNFRANETHVAEDKVLNLTPIRMSLDPSKCNHVNISPAVGGVGPDPGKYDGELVISGRVATTIRKEIIINVQTYECALDALNLTATRDASFLSEALLDLKDSYIPLKSPGNGYEPYRPKSGQQLGFVYYEGHIGNITVDSKEYKTEANLTLMPIRIDGLDEVGTYSGRLYPAGINNNSNSYVKVVVSVRDNIIFSILILVVGILLSLFSIFFLQNYQIQEDIKRRWKQVKVDYKDVKFPSLKPKYNMKAYGDLKDFKPYASPTPDYINAMRKPYLGHLNITPKASLSLIKIIVSSRRSIRCLRMPKRISNF
jgi:hypothetical protein